MPTTRCTTTAEFFTLNQLAQIDQQILQAKPSERAGLSNNVTVGGQDPNFKIQIGR